MGFLEMGLVEGDKTKTVLRLSHIDCLRVLAQVYCVGLYMYRLDERVGSSASENKSDWYGGSVGMNLVGFFILFKAICSKKTRCKFGLDGLGGQKSIHEHSDLLMLRNRNRNLFLLGKS